VYLLADIATRGLLPPAPSSGSDSLSLSSAATTAEGEDTAFDDPMVPALAADSGAGGCSANSEGGSGLAFLGLVFLTIFSVRTFG